MNKLKSRTTKYRVVPTMYDNGVRFALLRLMPGGKWETVASEHELMDLVGRIPHRPPEHFEFDITVYEKR